jgi:hypothetical protein
MSVRAPASILLVALWVAAPTFAADTAPVPIGFAAAATSTVPGLYAHAISYPDGGPLQRALKSASDSCEARGQKLVYAGDAANGINASWWLYRTGNETAIFRLTIQADIDPDRCLATFTEHREVLRSTEKKGAWPAPFSSGPLKCSATQDCYATTMFGIKTRCSAEGDGFQVMRHCISTERGPSQGLVLTSVYESDDMQGFGFEVRELATNVAIDASLFDESRAW